MIHVKEPVCSIFQAFFRHAVHHIVIFKDPFGVSLVIIKVFKHIQPEAVLFEPLRPGFKQVFFHTVEIFILWAFGFQFPDLFKYDRFQLIHILGITVEVDPHHIVLPGIMHLPGADTNTVSTPLLFADCLRIADVKDITKRR